MKGLHTIIILAAAFLAVFVEALPGGLRGVLRAQLDYLPVLLVYTALSADFATLLLLAVLGGLWHDSLSANPLGVSVLPLLVTGVLIQRNQELMLRDQAYAQFTLGLLASALVPALTLLLMPGSAKPLLGAGTLWQWFVLTLGGGLLTPLCFLAFAKFGRWFAYQPLPEMSFRLDRQIKRGRL